MKKGIFTSLVLLSGALACPGYAEKVQFEQLSPELQQKIRAQVGSAQIEDIDRETRGGKTIYEVGFKRNGQHTELQFEEPVASTPTSAAPAPSGAVDSRKISYNEVPAAVKSVADARIQGGEVNDVDRQVRNGQVTYEIGYKVAGGPQQELLVREDGTILSHSGAPSGPAVVTSPPTVTSPRYDPSIVTRAMNYEDLPGNVRRVAESRLRDGDVSTVERHVQGGTVNYEIGFQKENGQYQELVISEEGRVIRDEILSRSAVGSPGTVQSGVGSEVGTRPAEYANITTPVQLLNADEIERRELPVMVRRAVRAEAQNRDVDTVIRGQWRGRPVYQVGFTDENDRYVEVQYDENGRIIYDPRLGSTGGLLNNLGRAIFDND